MLKFDEPLKLFCFFSGFFLLSRIEAYVQYALGRGVGVGGEVLGGGIQAWWRFWSPFRSRILKR